MPYLAVFTSPWKFIEIVSKLPNHLKSQIKTMKVEMVRNFKTVCKLFENSPVSGTNTAKLFSTTKHIMAPYLHQG